MPEAMTSAITKLESFRHGLVDFDLLERYYISWEKEGIYYILQNCSSIEECKEIIQSIVY